MIPMETGEQGYSPHLLHVLSPGDPRVGCVSHKMDYRLTEGVYPEETMSPQDTEHAL